MQVANALNNCIRILFNPKVEAFKLFDFLTVKSLDDRYLGQIVEIYDDKFDASQNVAKIKLFYKITPNNEVMPYDNFTPNKECEIQKVKHEEIENFINQDKDTFAFGTNVKNQCSLNIQYDFFNNFPIILADKNEHANAISLNLAKNLSEKRKVVLIDATGVVEFEEAKKIKASKDFKLPLNFSTLDFIFEKCLPDATLEFQAIGTEILNEIKKFANKQESNFIPFNSFARVLLSQYRATPYQELKLLLARLRKLEMEQIFARSKRDKENLSKTVEKNNITIVDLSEIDISWQKAYVEYITEELSQDIYLILRVNDENCDTNLINSIYNKKTNIKFVPNVSYGYKKLPSLIQYCKNYVLMPSLYQRADFLDANFALSNLISDGCILFGENTDNFLYCAKDYELHLQDQRKNYRKIALTLIEEDQDNLEAEKGDYFDNRRKGAQASDFQGFSGKPISEMAQTQIESQEEKVQFIEEAQDDKHDDFEVVEDSQSQKLSNKASSNDDVVDFFDKKEETKNVSSDEFADLGTSFSELVKEVEKPQESEEDEEEIYEIPEDEGPQELFSIYMTENNKDSQEQPLNENNENNEEEISLSEEELDFYNNIDDLPDFDKEESEDEQEPVQEVKQLSDNDILLSEIEVIEDDEELEQTLVIDEAEDEFENIASDEPVQQVEKVEIEEQTVKEENVQKEPQITQEQIEKIEKMEVSNNAQEAIQQIFENEEVAQEKKIEQTEQVAKESEQEVVEINDENQDMDLSEIANQSLDNSFEQIINEKSNQQGQTITIDDDIKINLEIKNNKNTEDLPIFKEDKSGSKQVVYNVGDTVKHKQYGIGKVIQTIEHDDRQLVNIEFPEVGTKLLDPNVANVEIEQ